MIPQKSLSSLELLYGLWSHLTKRRRYQFALLMLLIMFSGMLEAFSLGAIVPFLAAISDPDALLSNNFLRHLAVWLDINNPRQLVAPLALIFLGATISSAAIRILNLWASTRLSYAVGSDFSVDCFNKTLNQSYEVHLARNSSLVLGVIVKKIGVAIAVLYQFTNMLGSVVILTAVIATLLYVNWEVTLLAGLSFAALYLAITYLSRRILLENSLWSAREEDKAIQILQEGIGGIRDIMLNGTQTIYSQKYSDLIYPVRLAQAVNVTLAGSPRYFMEAIGICIIVAMTYFLTLGGDKDVLTSLIPLLGAFAMGAQRLLPTLQQIYGSWAGIIGNYGAIVDVLEMLKQQSPLIELKQEANTEVALCPTRLISLRNVRYRYGSDQPWVFDNLSLEIPKGSRVGIIGSTGAGKSTFLDLLMGLLKPTEGHLLIDEVIVDQNNKRAWQNSISHVPQRVFLADTTIAENIALGIENDKVNMERIHWAAEQAQIADYIASQPDGYQSMVGERGNFLSGGQLQRIGIARALYKQASLLILDEATSALDSQTEDEVMKAIDKLGHNLTVLIVAHRLSTLKNCDQIIEVVKGGVRLHQDFKSFVKAKHIPVIDEK